MDWLIKDAANLPRFRASDGCNLAEVIHPQNDATAPGLSLARASLGPQQSTSPHLLDFVEIYYVISGHGLMHLNGRPVEVGPDACVYVPPHTKQWLENTDPVQDIVFLCICHPAYDPAGDRNQP